MHLSVLSSKQKKLLKELGFLKKYGFYLAGGTALALQIGHRTSVDFDFYTKKKFNSQQLREEFDKKFKRVREIYIAEDTLGLEVNSLGVSFFRYLYSLIGLYCEIEDTHLASLEDIAAMKILAISQRGRRRDFIDIYFLMRLFDLEQIIEFVRKKYPEFNIYVGLQGLTYFKDADEDPEQERYELLRKIKWNDVKKLIIKEVNKFQAPRLEK